MDERKFCFIICTESEIYYRECAYYISHLRIPEGYRAEILPVRDAKSMAAGYNLGMAATDAKYKIYLHQDTFILNPNFLNDLLTVFSMDERIAMIGMQGVEHISPDAVEWNVALTGRVYEESQGMEDYESYRFDASEGVTDCDYVRGFLIATSQDLPWREDLFDGWNFFDASQGFEFRKAGWRVVVPVQRLPWCAHDETILNLWTYDKYRRIFIQEYLP